MFVSSRMGTQGKFALWRVLGSTDLWRIFLLAIGDCRSIIYFISNWLFLYRGHLLTPTQTPQNRSLSAWISSWM